MSAYRPFRFIDCKSGKLYDSEKMTGEEIKQLQLIHPDKVQEQEAESKKRKKETGTPTPESET